MGIISLTKTQLKKLATTLDKIEDDIRKLEERVRKQLSRDTLRFTPPAEIDRLIIELSNDLTNARNKVTRILTEIVRKAFEI